MDQSQIDNSQSSKVDYKLIAVIVIIIILLFIIKNNDNLIENMSLGVVTQMYAQDAQDTYLKGNVNQLAKGNFLLKWNQPTRLSTGSYFYNTGPNRGALLKNLCYKCKKGKCNCKNGPVYYPMGYPGDYFEFPTPDINYPLPYIVSNGGFVREGFDMKEDFDTNTDKKSVAKLKLFYAVWCSHCTKFKPIFDDELKKKILDKKIPVELEAIDSDDNPNEARKYNIESFPTLILEIKDKRIKYKGEHTVEKILEFIKKEINI